MVPLWGAAFTALLVLIGAGSTVHVIPDPQNVMIKCKNQIPIVQWDYSHQQPQTTFKVNIRGSAGQHEYNKITDHQIDLSQFIWESEARYMAFHTVTVTAVMGGKESNPVEAEPFSFNLMKPAKVFCELDFPRVNLTVAESKATVAFVNPFSFYRELKQASKPQSAFFHFYVSGAINGDDCSVNQEICQYDITLPDNGTRCIKLNGWLMEGNEVGRVKFRETEDICPSSSMGDHWVVVILMVAVFVCIVIIISFIIYKMGAWTLKVSPLPVSLLVEPNPRNPERYSVLDSSAEMSHVQVMDRRASVDSMEEEEASPTAALLDSSSSSSSSNQEGMGLMSEGQTTDDDSANGSVETESVSMNSTEEEGEAASPYDRSHVLQIDMGDGDIVTAYTGN